MAILFPPQPVFPLAIDSDETLFLVYNTSETRLAKNNQAFSEEMEIVPVGADEPEIWADNGFANIEGELFYYNSVEKDSNGKVFKFKQIARHLGGKKSKFNLKNTWVRGFIVAEHHNQISLAIQQIERFVGITCTDTEDCSDTTLDCRIRRLIEEDPCSDDHNCPEVTLSFDVESTDNCVGTLIRFNVVISGNFTTYKLDFGDGQFTTASQTGTHLYAPNSTIDPVVSVGNDNCQILQTPIVRANPAEPEVESPTPPFEIPIPTVPTFPTVIIPEITVPSTTFELPQIFPPCDITSSPSFSVSPIPSVISIIPPINIPSVISISPAVPSIISFGLAPYIPPIILFGPAPALGPIQFGPAPTIQFGPAPTISVTMPSFAPLEFGPAPTISIADCPSCSPIEFGTPPTISVDWGTPPTCSVSIACPGSSTPSPGAPFRVNSLFLDDDFVDGFDPTLEVQANALGIPSEIKIMAPVMPDIKVVHDIPTNINILAPNIPDINIIIPPDFPREIALVARDIPKTIELVVPKDLSIPLRLEGYIPSTIEIKLPDNFTNIIKIDASGIPESIRVTGFPESIVIESNIPNKIVAELSIPEGFSVPLRFEGGPIPVQWDIKNIVGEQGDRPCFMMVPCDR